MSVEDIVRRVYQGAEDALPQRNQTEQQYLDTALGGARTPPAPTAPLNGPDRDAAKLVQESDRAIGPPSSGLPSPKVLGPLAEVVAPKSANEAITAWQKKDVDIRPTPRLADDVQRWGSARAISHLMELGLWRNGRPISTVDDKLIEDTVGAFMYVGAGLLGSVTPQDASDAMELAFDSYSNQVISRARSKTQEIIANNIDPQTGAGPAGASRDTLTAKGQTLVEQQDKIVNAALQLKSRKGEDAIQGAFKSLLIASNQKLQRETGADPEVTRRLRLQGKALESTNPTPQDVGRFLLSIQEDPGPREKPAFAVDPLTSPGRLMTRTAEVFKDIEDPLMAHRQIQQHFQSQINRARAQRIGADPDANHTGMLYHQFPNLAINLADAQLRSSVIKELRAEDIAEPKRFERKLGLARRKRLEPMVQTLFQQTRNLDQELQAAEARESISFITDLETAVKEDVGNVFEALAAAGTDFRRAALRSPGNKVRQAMNVALTGEAAFEAMQYAQEVAEEWETDRKIAAADPGELRFVVGTSMGANPTPQRVRPTVPPRVIPLENDFSNLRAVLISAERAGEMPYDLRKALFSDDPNDMVANAAVAASDVMAPRTVLRMINNGMSLAEVGTAFKQAQRVAFEEKVLPSTPGPDVLIGPRSLQELQDKESALINELAKLNPLERPTRGWGLSVALAQTRMERGWKEMALGFVEDPRTVFDTLAGVTPALVGGGVALQPVLSKARQSMVNAGLHTRLRQALGGTAAHDPRAVHAARKQVAEVLNTVAEPGGQVNRKMRKRQETYRALATTLEQIQHEQGRGTIGAVLEGGVPDNKKVTAAARSFKRTLRQIGLDEIKNLADGMGLPLQALAQMQQRGSLTVQAMTRLADRFKEVLNIDGVSIQPWTARNGLKAARKTVDALEAGALPDWETMSASLDAFSRPSDIFEDIADVVERTEPGSKRVIDSSGQYARTVVNWVARKSDDTLAARHLQARQRGNQVDFVEFMERKYEGELHDLEVTLPTTMLQKRAEAGFPLDSEGELILQAKDKLHERVRRTQRLRQTVDRTWDTPVNLANESIVADATDADLIFWGRNQGAAGDMHTFWRDNRRVGESFDDFNARTNRILAGIDRPTDSREGLRKSVARRYLNAPGLSTKQKFDTDSGIALTPEHAKRLRSERVSARNARNRYEELRTEIENFEATDEAGRRKLSGLRRSLRDARRRARFQDRDFHEKVLGENLGIRTEDLRTKYREIVSLAQVEDVLTQTGILIRAQDMTDGRISTLVQMVRDGQETMLLNQRAFMLQIENFNKRFNTLSPEQQGLYNQLLSKAADTGDMGKLRKAADRDEGIAGLITELDADNNLKVKQLLTETNHFRQNILRDMRNAGLITAAEFDTLVGGYAPHQYSSGKHRTLIGDNFDPDVFARTTEGGLDMSEMLRQQHFEKWKAIVSVRGGKSITHLFDTQADARKFIDIEYGKKGKFKEGTDGIIEGKSGLDDPVAILPPRGVERAEQLGFLGEGPSLFLRLETLVRDMTQGTILKTMDRPGWTFTDEQFQKVLKGKDATRFKNQFERLADTRQNGALRDKWVHKGVARMMERMERSHRGATMIGDRMRDLAEESSIVGKSIIGATLGAGVVASKLKNAIVTNKIARSLQTTFFNFLMDSEMFGVAAAGRDFSVLHPRALRNKRRATRDLFDQLQGKEASPEFIMASRLGVIDDTLIGHSIDPDVQKTVRKTLFGEVGQLKHLGNQSVKFLEGLNMPTMARALDNMIGGSDDPRILKLRQRWDEIDGLERRGVIDARDAAALQDEKLNIQALLEREDANVGNSISRGWRALNQIAIGDGKSGLFRDVDDISREVYARVSNINRLGAFYHMLEKGLSPDEAVSRLNLFMQNYSRVPEALRAFGRSPFGSPVVAFPYEQMRIMGNMLRYNPEMLMGFMGGFAATNFMSMVAGGLDPYRVMQGTASDSAGFPSWLSFASSLIMPHKDGTFSSMQIPALNWWQPAREPFGVQAKMFGLDDTPGLTAGEVATNIASKFLMGNPLTTTIYAASQHRDPQTGQLLAEGDSFMGRAASEIFELFVPPEIPFLGSISRQIAEGIEKPPYVRSGRETAPAQRALQSLLGVRLRGWLGSAGATAQIGEGMAKVLGVQAWTDLPVRGEPLRGFDDRDILSQLFVASRTVDPDNSQNERELDEQFTKLRKAQDLLTSEDPQEQEAGRGLRDEALKEYEEGIAPIIDFHGREIARRRTDQEQAQMLNRVGRTQNFEAQFDRLSISRKATVLVGAAMTGVNSQTFKDLYLRALSQDGASFRTISSLRSIEDALGILDRHIANPPTPQGLEELRRLRSYVKRQEAPARLRHEIKEIKDKDMRAASDLFWERNK